MATLSASYEASEFCLQIALNSPQHLRPCHILIKYCFVQSCLAHNTSVSLPPTILVVFFIPHLHVPVQEFSFVAVCKVEGGEEIRKWKQFCAEEGARNQYIVNTNIEHINTETQRMEQ